MILDVFSDYPAAREFFGQYPLEREHWDTAHYLPQLIIRRCSDILRMGIVVTGVQDVNKIRGLEFSRVVHHQPILEEAYALIEVLIKLRRIK